MQYTFDGVTIKGVRRFNYYTFNGNDNILAIVETEDTQEVWELEPEFKYDYVLLEQFAKTAYPDMVVKITLATEHNWYTIK